MRKKRFSVEQMIGVLKQAHVGVPVAEVMRAACAALAASFSPSPMDPCTPELLVAL
jgi:hypothetical protein